MADGSELAMIQSVVSSNRIEGVTVASDRLRPLVLGRAKPRDRSEEELAGAGHIAWAAIGENWPCTTGCACPTGRIYTGRYCRPSTSRQPAAYQEGAGEPEERWPSASRWPRPRGILARGSMRRRIERADGG